MPTSANALNVQPTNNTAVVGNGTSFTTKAFSSVVVANNLVAWDAASNLSANNMLANSFIPNLTSTATATGTTILSNTSTQIQEFTGTQIQTVQMPATSTLSLGQSYQIINKSTSNVTVVASDSSSIATLTPSSQMTFTCISTSLTSNAAWVKSYVGTVTNFSFTNGANVVGTVTNPATTVTLSLAPSSGGQQASSFASWDAHANLSANNMLAGYATTVTAAGTTSLIVGSMQQQYFTGSSTQTCTLPAVSTLALGQSYTIVNLSTGNVTVQSSGGNTLQAMTQNTELVATCISTSGTGTASWSWSYNPLTSSGGGITTLNGDSGSATGSTVTLTGGTTGLTQSGSGSTMTLTGTLVAANGGTGLTSPGTSGNILTSNGTAWVSQAPAAQLPVGSLQLVGTNGGTSVVPSNWLPCNGQIVSQATYPALFSQIGILDGPGSSPVWTANTINGTTFNSNDVAFGAGNFVLVGNTGAINYSTNGVSYTTATSGTSSNLNGVCYNSSVSLFCAVGAGGVVLTSTDGITWSSRTSGTTNQLNSVRVANGLFIAGANSGVIITSTNGISWSSISPSGAGSVAFGSAAYGNSTYAIVGTNTAATAIYTSTNASTWSVSPNFPYVANNKSLDFGNGVFVAGSTSGSILTSTDALTWKTRNLVQNMLTSSNGPTMCYNGQYFAAISQQGASSANSVLYSLDGVTWTGAALGFTPYAIASDFQGNFCIVGASGNIVTTTNFASFTSRTSGTASQLNTVCYGGGKFVAGGNSGTITYSTNLTSWTATTWSSSSNIYGLAYFSTVGLYMGVGANTSGFNSTNAVTWSANSVSAPSGGTSIIFGLNNEGYIGTSTGGIYFGHTPTGTWTSLTSGTSTQIGGLAQGNGLVAYRAGNTVGSSTNAAFNSSVIPIINQGIGADNNSIVFDNDNGRFLAPIQGTMYTSVDGASWSYLPDGLSAWPIEAIRFNGYTFLIMTDNNTIGNTYDGLSMRWTNFGFNQPTNTNGGFAYGAGVTVAAMNNNSMYQTQMYDPTVNFKLPNQNQYGSSYPMLDANANFKAQWYIKAL